MSTSLPIWLALVCAASACTERGPVGTPYVWQLPPSFPEPIVPADNPITEEKVALGRRLFYDPRVSYNESYACATCHLQAIAFSDSQAHAIGSTGQTHRRNSMALSNVAYHSAYTWANSLEKTLEHQMLTPLFGEFPVEMGLAGREAEMLERLQKDADYPALFRAAFGGDGDPIALDSMVKAIASFERTLISGGAPYTLAVHPADLPPAVRRGADLFFSERLECYHCHSGFSFSDSIRRVGDGGDETAFHNTGLYNLDGLGAYPRGDTGLVEISGKPEDMGKFRAPSLLNIARTGPYFHDGSAATLKDVIAHYSAGGRRIDSGPNAGDGSTSPLKDGLIVGFSLSAEEEADLLAFLGSLTDETFLHDARFSNPFVDCPPRVTAGCDTPAPSWAAEIRPLVEARCTSCHAAGQVGSAMPLSTYAQLFELRANVAAQVEGCMMPPPLTAPALSPSERDTLLRWLACDAPEN